MKGTLYGVSVGPGDPELLTLKAVRIIASCAVIAAPQTAGEKTLALDIASGAVDMDGKEILILPFLMTRDRAALERSHRELADKVEQRLALGQDVAMLNLGDVSVYSSFCYIMELTEARGYTVRMIPGVTSFCAVAATLGTSLTTMNSPLHIIPAGGMELDAALALDGTRVLMKTGKSMKSVKEHICKSGLAGKTLLVQNCGLPNQKICRDIAQADEDISYFTTVIIKE